jgi:hypothetical protein
MEKTKINLIRFLNFKRIQLECKPLHCSVQKKYFLVSLYVSILVVLFSLPATLHAQKASSTLEENFKNPPPSTKPKTWMHAMSGNMSKAGLTKDLEAMAKAGIGGLLLFNITQGIPDGPIKYNSEEHHQMITHAATEAERLGLSFGVHNCDGWSSSGGPWVKPDESMKMMVWSDTVVSGGSNKTFKLRQPTTRENYYRDIAVLAYPSLPAEIEDAENKPVVKASDPKLNINVVTDFKIDGQSKIEKVGDESPWIQFSYPKSKSIRSVYLFFNDRETQSALEVSEDGVTFTNVKKELFKVRTSKSEWAINDHFEAITSKYFRVKFNQATTLKEVQLTSVYRVNNILGRSSIARTNDDDLKDIGNPQAGMLIDINKIKNLTSSFKQNGNLTTNLPNGNWTIIRIGYTSTGAVNSPASNEGKGLEVDKLSRPAFKKHYDAFVKKVIDNSKPSAPNALQYIEIDSYEMGGQNWTDRFDKLFMEKYQ